MISSSRNSSSFSRVFTRLTLIPKLRKHRSVFTADDPGAVNRNRLRLHSQIEDRIAIEYALGAEIHIRWSLGSRARRDHDMVCCQSTFSIAFQGVCIDESRLSVNDGDFIAIVKRLTHRFLLGDKRTTAGTQLFE